MTPEGVRWQVAAIAAMHDNESAHLDEDNLYLDVLRAIAEGAEDPAALAAEALKASELDYTRWYA